MFTVTVNTIKQMPELTDDWVKENSGTDAQTVDEYKEEVKKQLEKQNAYDSDNEMKGNAWTSIVEDTEILAFPKKYLDEQMDELQSQLDKEIEMYETTKEEYLEQIGMTQEDLDAQFELSARESARNRLIAEAIAEAEGIDEESEEYKTGLEIMEDEYGDFMVEQYVLIEAVMVRIIDKADITDVAGADEPEFDEYSDEIILEEPAGENQTAAGNQTDIAGENITDVSAGAASENTTIAK